MIAPGVPNRPPASRWSVDRRHDHDLHQIGRALASVHLILTPATPEGSPGRSAKYDRRYSGFGNALEHLMAAARYGAMNPVRVRLVERAEDWP